MVGNEAATAENEAVLTSVVQKASSLTPGTGAGQVGPVIDKQSQAKILSYVNNAVEKDGATLLVDGRTWAATGICAYTCEYLNTCGLRGCLGGPCIRLWKQLLKGRETIN